MPLSSLSVFLTPDEPLPTQPSDCHEQEFTSGLLVVENACVYLPPKNLHTGRGVIRVRKS
jgi:hypothetical protein